MARNDNFFNRLTRLFRSGPAIQRKVKGYNYNNYFDNDIIRGNYGYRAPFPFGRESSPFSVLGAYGLLDRMSRYAEFCFSADTCVYTLDGVYTIKELAEKYPNGENIKVYSYDHSKNEIVVATAHHPRITKDGKVQKLVQITFEDGGKVKTTLDHKFLLRAGEYVEAKDLIVGQALMPFYVKDITASGYKHIYTINKKEHNPYGWTAEHILVAEHFLGRKLNPQEVVHHVDFNPSNNLPSNLKVMTEAEHRHYHSLLNNNNKKGKSNKKHSVWMRNNNPVKRQEITALKIFETASAVDFSLAKTKRLLKADVNLLKRRLREIGYENWLDFKADKDKLTTIRNAAQIYEEMQSPEIEDIIKTSEEHECQSIYRLASILKCTENSIRRRLSAHGYGSWSEFMEKSPKRTRDSYSTDNSVSYQQICDIYDPVMSAEMLAEQLNTSINKIKTCIERQGFNSFGDWKLSYTNHKIASIEFLQEEEVVYNITVDEHHNLAVGSKLLNPITNDSGSTTRTHSMVICRQSEMEYTPEIAAALNIYADECTTGDERGKTFHILSSNPQIKKSLDELFYDILNIEFNLRPWVRNLVKYGDLFLYNEVIPDIGVVNVQPIRVNELEREEGWDPNDPYAVRFKWLTRGNRYLENWQVTHMRILGNDMFLPYGTSVLEPARRIWRQLTMMEDSMLVYRVVRSPERRVFYIDVGNIAPNDIPSYMEQAKQTLRARDVVSRQDGRVDQRYNPLPVHKDTPIPLLDGRTISIEDLSKEYDTGKENWVYSMQDQTQQIVPGKVIWCGKNYTAQKLIKVWLDDDTYITTAPEHPFVLRDGSSKRADELIIGQSLMPFYRDENSLGYERCYNPATQKYETTHSLVAKNIFSEKWIKTNQPVVHHKKPWQGQSNKKNNHPSNLEIMNFWEHRKWHRDFIQHTLLREDVLKENSKRICEFNKTLEHSINVSQTNRKYNKGKKLAQAYNGTELHKQHNELRTRAQKESWEKNSLSRRKAMRWNIPELFWAELSKIVKENPTLGREKIHNLLMQNESIVQALKANQNTERSVEKFSFAAWEGELVRKGFAKLAGYREHILNEQNIGYKNHKIKNIEALEVSGEDVYCMTVVGPEGEDDRHNFAAQTICNDNKASNNGVFVLNSVDDDYFIPVRGGQTGTKIETLAGGQNATATEDVEYLQKKLFAAIQVPKPYLNFTEGMSAKASLAQQDVRFSRTIIALQKIAIAELNKLAMIHLYSKGFNEEDLLDFHLKLANPSTIALLQKLENLASKFDIAAKAKETKLVDELWIQKNIIELSDDELMNIEQGRREDKIREVELESIAVSANPDPGPARMVSPFDNSNYEIPGEDVSRVKPSKEDDFFQKMDDYSQIQNYKKEQEEETFARPDVNGTSPPVQATPFVKRTEKNRLRRVGAGGKSNLEMPDFGAMFDRKNVSLTDIYDKKFLDNPLIERVLEEELNLNANNFIPRDFVSTLDKLKIFLEQNRVKTKMVLEENEQIEIKMNNDELLIESVDRGNESSDENEKVDISEIDLSRID